MNGFLEISGFPGYWVNENGDIISTKRKNVKKLSYYVDGKYYRVVLRKKFCRKQWFLVHRIVAMMFIKNPKNKPFVNHKDGNKLNNHASNLEWVSPLENNFHSLVLKENGRAT